MSSIASLQQQFPSSRHQMIAQRLSEFLSSPNIQMNAELAARFDESTREQLIDSLVDGTVFSILESLKDLQILHEQELWQQREKDLEQLRISTGGFVEKQRMYEIDCHVLERIDQIAHEQQSTLICAGVPLFKSSMEPAELRLQMAIIQFILTLGSVYDSQ